MFKITYMIGNKRRESVDYLFPEHTTGETFADAADEIVRLLKEDPLQNDQFIEIVSVDEIICYYDSHVKLTLRELIMEKLNVLSIL